MYYPIINENTFLDRNWKIGIICDEDGKAIQHKFELANMLYDTNYNNGQIQIAIDITNEYNQFQNILKNDYMEYHGNMDQWKDNTYFRYFVGQYKDKNQESRKWVFYWAHLDDSLEIAPYQTYTKGQNSSTN